MLDLGSLFSGIDNIYKFLTIGGLLMFTTSMLFPLQKEHALKIEIINHNKTQDLLNNDNENLLNDIAVFKARKEKILIELDSISKLKICNKTKSERYTPLKKEFNTKLTELKKTRKESIKKQIHINHNLNKINILQENRKEISNYTCLLKYPGISCFVIGLLFWIKSTKTSENLKKEELIEYKNRNN